MADPQDRLRLVRGCTHNCNQGRTCTCRRPRRGVPVVIHCHRTSLLTRAGWLLADLWAFLKAPRFRL